MRLEQLQILARQLRQDAVSARIGRLSFGQGSNREFQAGGVREVMRADRRLSSYHLLVNANSKKRV
jgi:hypothetical protein